MKLAIFLIALVLSVVSGTYIQFVKSGLQNKIKAHIQNKLMNQMKNMIQNSHQLKVQGHGWPSKLKEVFGPNSEIDKSDICQDKTICRPYDLQKNEAVSAAWAHAEPINEDQEIFYVETLRKSNSENDWTQMLFSVLPKNDEDAADSNAVKNSKFFSVCVPVNVKDSPFIFQNCPLDDCQNKSAEGVKECTNQLDLENIQLTPTIFKADEVAAARKVANAAIETEKTELVQQEAAEEEEGAGEEEAAAAPAIRMSKKSKKIQKKSSKRALKH